MPLIRPNKKGFEKSIFKVFCRLTLSIKQNTYLLAPREINSVFCGPETAVVTRGEISVSATSFLLHIVNFYDLTNI